MNPLIKPTIANSSSVFDNSNIRDKVTSYLGDEDLASFFAFKPGISTKSYEIFKDRYQKMFGEINSQFSDPKKDYKKIMAQLLLWGEKQPDATANHNIYKAPKNWFEKLKWLIEVDNPLDEKVKKIYDGCINLLENTQSHSILQLQHLMHGFWHADRQIKDYQKYKSDEKAKITNNLIKKIAFAVLWIIFKLIYKSYSLNVGETLQDRSELTCAIIGDVELNGKKYHVVAIHPLGDERTQRYFFNRKYPFYSLFNGETMVGILEQEDKDSGPVTLFNGQEIEVNSIIRKKLKQNFTVKIARQMQGALQRYRSESLASEGSHIEPPPVLKSQRYVVVKQLTYDEQTKKVEGSDRRLDQIFTQIMIEMLMQNHAISLQAEGKYDDLVLLAAGGFKIRHNPHLQEEYKKIIENLHTFRSKEGNKLFPPLIDYGAVPMEFNREEFTHANVLFSRDGTESWADIIARNPILKPNSAVLPEYWADKPNIVEE